MSGLVKAKAYKVEDSNVEKLGGKENKDAVKNAGITDPAWSLWESYRGLGANGKTPILKSNKGVVKDSQGIPHYVEKWRIEKFKVVIQPHEDLPTFYEGDSYIVLHCFQAPAEQGQDGKLLWNLHFWLGASSSQDEMGTAAYKTVELDTILDDGPVQFRECMGYESQEFLTIFSDIYKCGGIKILQGGIDSGFKHVTPEAYKPRLLHLKGRKKVRVTQVDLSYQSMNSGDLFILDNGLSLYVFVGKEAGMAEKNKGREVGDALKTERKGRAKVINLREGQMTGEDDYKEFFRLLGSDDPNVSIKTAAQGGVDDEVDKVDPSQKQIWRVSDASGSLKFTKESEGKQVATYKMDPNDCFVFDGGFEIFIWVGKGATKEEKDKSMECAVKYLKDNGRPSHLPITRVLQGAENPNFRQALMV